MIIKRLLLLFSLMVSVVASYAQVQDGSIRGKVTNADGGEALPFVDIMITNGTSKKSTQTDEEGSYRITGLQPGKYTLFVQTAGFKQAGIQGVTINPDKTQYVDVKLTSTDKVTDVIEFVQFKTPIFEKDATSTGATINKEAIQRAPVKGVGYLATTTSGAVSGDGGIAIRGQRSNGTVIFVDGVKVIGSGTGMAQSGIENISVITGGVPAEYGDATGGIISITTRGPAAKWSGGFDAQSSKFLDAFNYNSFEGNISGPILKKKYYTREGKDSASRPLLGMFASAIFNYSKDGSPSGVELVKVKDDVLEDLKNNPLREVIDPNTGQVNYVSKSKYITRDQMETTKFRPNTSGYSYNVTAKFDYQPSDNFNITLGGNFFNSRGNAFIRQYSLLNTENNPVTSSTNYRTFLRFRQNFANNNDKDAVIKNAYYILQFDYQKQRSETYAKQFEDRLFEYGYVGQFDIYQKPFYSAQTRYVVDQNTGKRYELKSNFYLGNSNDSLAFTRGGFNRVAENYTQNYIDFNDGRIPASINAIQQNNGIINGFAPGIVNNLWSDVGSTYGSYSLTTTDQFSINFQTVANIKKHSLKFGVQFDQRISRGYSSSPQGLWTLARQLVNKHLVLDTANPILLRDGENNFKDTVNFNYISGGGRTYFDIQLRNELKNKGYKDELGNAITETSFINTDRLKPSDLNIAMFSADELLNQGNSYVNYYGYDYKGKVQRGTTSVNDFLNDTVNRRISPYQPIYIAGFIQDKFEFKDITFNIGVRVDRFDANQIQLKDIYSVFPTRTVKELEGKTFGSTPYKKPENIGDDYVPYVNDPLSPTQSPIGYRNPTTNKWYDAKGIEVADVNSLASLNSGQLFPYLASNATRENYKRPVKESFRDYTPQTTFMPRVSFSFPINDKSVFFANYNVLTQRPKEGNFATVDDFYYLQQLSTGIISNPGLKPEKRINYEIGFKQQVGTRSALTLQAFYGEIRDLIQIQQIAFAWPVSYTTTANIDFGTVKGLTFIYDLRRVKSSGIEVQANYTLQFANGTGSNSGSQGNLIAAGVPNLRTPLPLDYDIRHAINTTIDYRFGNGSELTGPKFLQDAGFFFVVTGRSGTPYSRQTAATQDVSIGIAQRRNLQGDPNSARLPWNAKIDFTFDKNLTIKGKEVKDAVGTSRKGDKFVNLYLTVQNVLNTQNIASVYRYTGSATDDGFLSSPQGQQTVSALTDLTERQAFVDQYTVKLNNPGNYGAPRIIRLGARFNF